MIRWVRRRLYRGKHWQQRGSVVLPFLVVLLFGILASLTQTTPQVVPVKFPGINKLEAEGLIQKRQQEVADRAALASRSQARAKPPTAPSMGSLIPRTPQGNQVAFWPKPSQMNNARTIVQVAREMKLPYRAMTIAIATALQESHLNNYGHLGARNDHDSLGLFQQRPSAGWGTPAQVTNPRYAATVFYKSLLKVPGWQNMPLTVAAQRVQVSAFPFAYAKWEAMAGHVVRGAYGVGPYAGIK